MSIMPFGQAEAFLVRVHYPYSYVSVILEKVQTRIVYFNKIRPINKKK